ncbi:MAG: Helix-turn-helix transcriptional regulator [Nocardioidaceae bacterium]|nr:Helix-turn-helix transcriptional regulator [Nocardioidaceae bacterium]
MTRDRPLRIAIVNDYEIVVKGLAQMFAPFGDRVQVVEVAANLPATERADIALYDTFSQTDGVTRDIAAVLSHDSARAIVVYSWNLQQALVDNALRRGAAGYLAKRLGATELVDALERIADGEVVISPEDPPAARESGDWPGRDAGLTTRESEIIALITQGLSNQDIADRAFLSINSVKSYIRSSYRKMGVGSRSQAVLWGIENGFRPDHLRFRRDDEQY